MTSRRGVIAALAMAIGALTSCRRRKLNASDIPKPPEGVTVDTAVGLMIQQTDLMIIDLNGLDALPGSYALVVQYGERRKFLTASEIMDALEGK